MTRVVLDASVVVNAVLGRDADRLADVLVASDAHAPDLLWPELLSALVRLQRVGALDAARVAAALELVRDLPIAYHPLADLLPQAHRLSDRHSAYDAFYVALAEVLRADLVTADRRLAAAAHLAVRVLPPVSGRGSP